MSHLLIEADTRRIPLADRSVHCVVTSPPYFGLRSYLPEGHPRKHLEMGGEATPEEFAGSLVRVFREIRRVLRDDGTVFLNLGDSYAGGGGGNYSKSKKQTAHGEHVTNVRNRQPWLDAASLKPKDLIGIPWMVAFALRADGWYLRSEIIWNKRNPMPESVNDRPTKSHEQVFLLAKKERYFFDSEAVKEPAIHAGKVVTLGEKSLSRGQATGMGRKASGNGLADSVTVAAGRNIRSVWTISTRPFRGAHFATMPAKLVEPCIKAGTSERGCCPTCGKPWVRVVERESKQEQEVWSGAGRNNGCQAGGGHFGRTGQWSATSTTTGWRPACECPDHEPIPCVVLDPFNGSGTTGVVAGNLGRRYVGLDLSADYLAMAGRRIARPHRPDPRPRGARKAAGMPLFAGDMA